MSVSRVQMNVAPLVLRTQTMDKRVNSVVYVKVLYLPMKILLSVSPYKEMGKHTRQGKEKDL